MFKASYGPHKFGNRRARYNQLSTIVVMDKDPDRLKILHEKSVATFLRAWDQTALSRVDMPDMATYVDAAVIEMLFKKRDDLEKKYTPKKEEGKPSPKLELRKLLEEYAGEVVTLVEVVAKSIKMDMSIQDPEVRIRALEMAIYKMTKECDKYSSSTTEAPVPGFVVRIFIDRLEPRPLQQAVLSKYSEIDYSKVKLENVADVLCGC